MVRGVLIAAAAAFLSACGGGGGGSGGGGPPFGLQQRVGLLGLNFPSGAVTPPGLRASRAFPSLTFSSPVFLTAPTDGTDRIFVVEQRGRIYVFPNSDAVAAATLFLDITSRVVSGGELGLFSIAFDPAFATNGTFYLHYTADAPLRSVISRFRVSSGNPDVADASSEAVLLEVAQPYSNHNGGSLTFGPDDHLYIALGDGGSGGDPLNAGQDLTNLLGKILRIDPDLPPPYIPGDNPFVGAGGGARGQIWAYGLRNPWRISFDRGNGDLWCGDVGQGAREEVGIVTRGANMGWRVFEGNLAYDNPSGLPASGFTAPVLDYGRSQGTTVIGGYVYRGSRIPTLRGAYLYADYGSGRVWALVASGTSVVSNQQLFTLGSPSSFGEDRDGEVYIVSLNGGIFRLQETGGGGPAPAFPTRLSGTGLFTNVASLTPNPGLVEYDLRAPLWSDGARKRRWIGLPGNSRAVFHATEPWTFPVGTVLVKHFEIDLAPSGTRRLETRVLLRESAGWAGYTYVWNDAQSDADLLSGSATRDFLVPGSSGPETVTWTFPSGADCLRCHTAAAGTVLGVRTRQLNRDFDYPAATDNQLRSWNHIGLLDRDIGPSAAYESYPRPEDTSAPLGDRARAYIAANCAQCHLPAGPAPGGLDLRYGIPVASMNLVGIAPSEGSLGLVNAQRIRSGSKESSVLWERMRRLDSTRMPPLASHRVDAFAVQLLGAWIDSGP
ncbi:MAG: PQQ-dependent sugar dehydrogenase [Planctomycetaceae bacterium]